MLASQNESLSKLFSCKNYCGITEHIHIQTTCDSGSTNHGKKNPPDRNTIKKHPGGCQEVQPHQIRSVKGEGERLT